MRQKVNVIIKQNAAEILEKELKSWYKKNPDKPPKIYSSVTTLINRLLKNN